MTAPLPEQEASDPATAAARLRELGRGACPRARSRVAANPAAPLDLLLELAREFPAQVAHNPALALGLLEQPDALRRGPPLGLGALARCPDLPPWLFEALLAQWECEQDLHQHDLMAMGLAQNPATPPSYVRKLCTGPQSLVRGKAAQHPAAPRDELTLLVQAGSDPTLLHRVRRLPRIAPERLRCVASLGSWGAELAASHPKTPPDLLDELGRHPRPSVVAAAAENVAAPAALLVRLAEAPELVVRRAVARNPSAPPEALERLAQSKELDVLALVIRHRATPPAVLQAFADDRRLYGALAQAPRTPPELLDRLARDRSLYVRRQVAKNPSLPADSLRQLAGSSQYLVRLGALLNPSLPLEEIERLAQDRSREVRERAVRTLDRRRKKAAQ